MTFSSNHSVYAQDGKFLEEVSSVITSHGFQINDKKTRLQKKGARQEVTGIIVSDKINTYREYRKNLKAAVFHAETNGRLFQHGIQLP